MKKTYKSIISIIMPLYNNEDYIEQCLEGIMNQNFQEFELIIVNDCSTDNSESKVQKFISKNPSLQYIYIKNKQNRGPSYSRNIGLQKATGDFVCFLDSDDIYHPDFLKLLYYKIMAENTDLVFCGYNRCKFDGVTPYTQTWKYPDYKSIFRLKMDFLLGNTQICHCTVLYKKEFLLQKKLQYVEGCRSAADTEFIVKVLFCNPSFSCVPDALYNYIIHPGSISTKPPSIEKIDGYYAYERARKYIQNPFWKLFFLLTKESRKIARLVDEFQKNNLNLPLLFCSKYKIVFFLANNLVIKRTSSAYLTLIQFYSHYIRKE